MQDRDAERRRAGLVPTCHFFNSFFVNKLYKDAHAYSYKAVQRWTLPKKLKLQNQARALFTPCVTVRCDCGVTCSQYMFSTFVFLPLRSAAPFLC